jgi:hypothetical protein
MANGEALVLFGLQSLGQVYGLHLVSISAREVQVSLKPLPHLKPPWMEAVRTE